MNLYEMKSGKKYAEIKVSIEKKLVVVEIFGILVPPPLSLPRAFSVYFIEIFLRQRVPSVKYASHSTNRCPIIDPYLIQFLFLHLRSQLSSQRTFTNKINNKFIFVFRKMKVEVERIANPHRFMFAAPVKFN